MVVLNFRVTSAFLHVDEKGPGGREVDNKGERMQVKIVKFVARYMKR